MDHPRLTDSQLRDLQPGDRVSRYSHPGEVQTAPVARLTATQVVVLWPDETEGRYWRESGSRTNCRGEVLRMPAEEPAPVDAPAADIVEQLLTAAAMDGKREPVVYDDGLWDAAGDDRPSDKERAWLRYLADTYHSLPLADAIRRWREHRASAEDGGIAKSPGSPSATALPAELLTLSTPSPVFYAALGPFLGSHAAAREIGAPVEHREGKTWVVALVDGMPVGCGAVFLPAGDTAELASAYVLPEFRHVGVYRTITLRRVELANVAGKTNVIATCTQASAAILGRLGFVDLGPGLHGEHRAMSLRAR
jgi:hypothetical protein